LKAELEREADERGVSRSKYIRTTLEERHKAGRLRERLDVRGERIDELETQLAKRSQVASDRPDPGKAEHRRLPARRFELTEASYGRLYRFTGDSPTDSTKSGND
jgi:hypothetical protein